MAAEVIMSHILYTPKQAAQELNIASSTLRLWAAKFSSVLSSHANPPKAASAEQPAGHITTRISEP